MNATKKKERKKEGRRKKKEEKKKKGNTNEKKEERVFPSRWKRCERQRTVEEKQEGSSIIV